MEVAVVQGPGDMIRATGTMNDALAQLCHMRRSMQQLELIKAGLERELHDSETANRKLIEEAGLAKEELKAQREVAAQEIAKLRREMQQAPQRAASPNGKIVSENNRLKENISQLQQQLDDTHRISPRRPPSRGPSPEVDHRRIEELEKENEHLHERVKNLEFLCDTSQTPDHVEETNKYKDRIKHLEIICEDKEIISASQALLERLWESVQNLLDIEAADVTIHPTWVEIDRTSHLLSNLKQVTRKQEAALIAKTEAHDLLLANHNARISSYEAQLKIAREAVEAVQLKGNSRIEAASQAKEAAEIEKAKQLAMCEATIAELRAANDILKNSISAKSEADRGEVDTLRNRCRTLENDLLDGEVMVEKLTNEMELMIRKSESDGKQTAIKSRQHHEQLTHQQNELNRVQAVLQATTDELRKSNTERDAIRLECATLRERCDMAVTESDLMKHRLASFENNSLSKDLLAQELQQTSATNAELQLKVNELTMQLNTMPPAAPPSLSSPRRQTDEEKMRAHLLSTLPIGSPVSIKQHENPKLVNVNGIVIAHALSPQGEPGALIGLPSPLPEELVLVSHLTLLPKRTPLSPGSPSRITRSSPFITRT